MIRSLIKISVIVAMVFALPAYASLKDGIKHYKKRQFVEALSLFMPFAMQGNIVAQYYIGQMYRLGQGADSDGKRALFWLRKAAAGGHVQAQFNLGSMYNNGELVSRNYMISYLWFQQAAAQGNQNAKMMRLSVAKNMSKKEIEEVNEFLHLSSQYIAYKEQQKKKLEQGQLASLQVERKKQQAEIARKLLEAKVIEEQAVLANTNKNHPAKNSSLREVTEVKAIKSLFKGNFDKTANESMRRYRKILKEDQTVIPSRLVKINKLRILPVEKNEKLVKINFSYEKMRLGFDKNVVVKKTVRWYKVTFDKGAYHLISD